MTGDLTAWQGLAMLAIFGLWVIVLVNSVQR